ncbi:MAG: universal stress protein [Nitrospirae bacterium]|nr:universal stress protein [Nitrospirota bacterium]
MYETLVVGFDDSLSSKAALVEASNRIRKHGGKLIMVHAVYFDTEEYGIAPEQLEKRMKIGEKACIQSKEKISSEFGIDVQSLLCEGDPPDVILDVAQGKKADLIVLGTYGRRGLNRLLMGSVTSRIIVDAPTDVLVVKKACTECTGEYANILVPYDGSDFSKRALTRASQISKVDSSTVTVLYVIPRYEEMIDFFKSDSIRKSLMQEAEKITAGAKELAAQLGTVAKTRIEEGHSSDRIVEIAKEQNHDLIVMGSHGYRGVNKAIMGSTTERVILNASCPTLIVR